MREENKVPFLFAGILKLHAQNRFEAMSIF